VSLLGNLFPGIQHLQNIHPLLVHFPIAYLCGALLFYGLAWVLKSERLEYTGFLILSLGTLAAAAAVAAGLRAEATVLISPSVRAHLLEHHEDLMLTTLGLSIAATAWAAWDRPFPRRGRPLFFLLLLVMVTVMALGADFGARMVYDYNVGGRACPQPLEFTR